VGTTGLQHGQGLVSLPCRDLEALSLELKCSSTSICITEILRENKRMLDKAMRELDRERMGLQNQEKKLIAEIKKMAKEGQLVR
jgi:hypothetical protein